MPNTIAQNLTRLANAKEAIAEAIETKGVTLGENDGFEDFANAIMEINGGGTAVLITKSITANGTYNAINDNADGYSSVTVNVPELPVTFLKSIKSTGNSVILTDIVNAYTDEVFLDIKLENPSYESGGDSFYGVRDTTQHFVAAISKWDAYSNASVVSYIGFTPSAGDVYGTSASDYNLGKRNTFIIRRGNGKCIYGDASFEMAGSLTDSTPSTGSAIFGVIANNTVTPYYRFNLTIYGIQMTNSSGTLIHNLVPAQSKATGRGGLYDIITGTFYASDSQYDDVVKESIT